MDMLNPRLALDRLITDNHEDYSSLSRLLGRNPAYIQQYIKRGTPRKLDEQDRGTLARYFGVSESLLGGPVSSNILPSHLVEVPLLEISASAGSGSFVGAERTISSVAFDRQWLRRLTGRADPNLSIIRVSGDSMEPTLSDNDQAMVDLDSARDTLRDGVYVLRIDEMLNVKRISVDPDGQVVSIVSDNALYRSWSNVQRASLDVIGRVIWVGRSFA
jgi:phage repressor protein C with HTH and peptisase S24 domain